MNSASAFTEGVSYTLDARGQAEIGLKGMRIQVQSADNKRIAYRVLKPME